MNKHKMILRTHYAERLCHWLMVICFLLVALSGLSWFFPSLSWLGAVFGTPQLARILHPFFGVVVFVALMFLFVRFVRYNLLEAEDRLWFRNLKNVLHGHHDEPLEIGKYNAGQKLLFWGLMLLISALLVTGLIIWRPYFAPLLPIPLIRIGLLLHAVAAIALMLLIIGHAYLAFWVKGSISGMISGYVSHSWAKRHHPRWHRQVLAERAAEERK
jgi:formate dehydrogenase subunit gamma